MPDSPAAESPADLSEVGELLTAWDGSLTQAEDLRRRVRLLPNPRRAPANSVEAVLFTVRSGYQSRSGGGWLERIRKDPEPRVERWFGPFIGDVELGRWPFHEPDRISDDQAVAWLPIVGRSAAVDEVARAFVEILFLTRRRPTWIPASFAYAAMAARDQATATRLVERFGRIFPDGLPKAWPGGKLASKVQLDAHKAHEVRHVLHLACAYAAAAGPRALPGFDPGQLAAMPLPASDASDTSAVLESLSALLGGPRTRPPVIEHLRNRLEESVPNDMQEEALRTMAGRTELPNHCCAAILDTLTEPRWQAAEVGQHVDQRLDALASWVRTATWLAEGPLGSSKEPQDGRLASMRARAGEAADLLTLALDDRVPLGWPDARTAAVARIGNVFNPDRRATARPARLAMDVAELLELAEHVDLRSAPWPSLLRLSGGVGSTLEGPVSAAIGPALALEFATGGHVPALLLRDEELATGTVIELAKCQDGFVARQVAVQAERMLRELPPGEAQVDFLWALFQRDPPGEMFRQLLEALRGTGTALHGLVESLGALDEARDKAQPYEQIVRCYRRADEAAVKLVGSAGSAGDRPLALVAGLLGTVEELARATDVGSVAWVGRVGAALIGAGVEKNGGLAGWLRWLEVSATKQGYPHPPVVAAQLTEGWSAVRQAIDEIAAVGPAASDRLYERLLSPISKLAEVLSRLSWPERRVLEKLPRALVRWCDERARDARLRDEDQRRRQLESEKVNRHLDDRNEVAILGFLDKGEVALVGPDELRRMNHFLLDRLRYRKASQLRDLASRRTPDPVQLRSYWSHLSPLLTGAAAGPFLVLDVGTAWNDLAQGGTHQGAYWGTIGITMFLSFALLAANLGSRVGLGHKGASAQPDSRTSFLTRILGLWAILLVLAFMASGLALWTLQGTLATAINNNVGIVPLPFAQQWGLWAPLSLFLGLLMGILLQGRSLTNSE